MVLLPTTEITPAGDDIKVITTKKMSNAAYIPNKILLNTVNPYITCNLCKGYLIDATTIVECLHSFCHSCIMKHLRTEQYCPQCEMMINKAKPNIKPDATLQAIVYKLVPGLYEKELLRKRAFYRCRPEDAMIATPEQRGEDTEHLIFSPHEKISLSLEYADKEFEYNVELEKPKYLLCPAIFTIANLKKFIIYKYGIPANQFHVEIMYKVKTIVLPDHYTLMDIAYIYTWKREAPMRYFYRIRTNEMKSVELPEVPIRRSPSLSTRASLPAITEEDATTESSDKKEDNDLLKLSENCDNKSNASDSVVVESKVEQINEKPKVKKNESIKLKIEMSKNTYVSILQSPEPVESNTKHHKSDKSEKSKRKKSDSSDKEKDKSVSKNKTSSELKIKIEKVKENKSSKKSPYKVEHSGSNNKLNDNNPSESKKVHKRVDQNGHKIDKAAKKGNKSPKTGVEPIKIQPSIVLKIDQKSPGLSTSSFKIASPNPAAAVGSPNPNQSPESELDEKKSKFLNVFQLTPIKYLSPTKPTVKATPGIINVIPLKNLTENETKSGSSKRKNKDPIRSILKKPKVSDDEIKAMVEKAVKEKTSKSPEQNVPTIPTNTNGTTDKKETKSPEKVVKKDEFEFKSPIMVNSKASRPHQADTPRPHQNIKRPAVPMSKLMQPLKKLPPLLPKDIDYMKNNKQKILDSKKNSTNARVTPSVSPNRETEINKLSAEDMKKNVKVYGPASDNDNFAMPSAVSVSQKLKNKNNSMNYLNFAMLNSNKASPGCRTPIPSYSVSSPSYSPDSPQYNPNYNISTKQFKYTNPLAYANFMQNMLNDRGSPVPSDKPTSTDRKRPCSSPENTSEPPEKQPKVQSLLNQINIPSSLSITLASDQDEPSQNFRNNVKPANSPNNYIEILKLPEISITETDRKSPLDKEIKMEVIDVKDNVSPNGGDKKTPTDPSKGSFQQKFLQSILEKEKIKDIKITHNAKKKKEKQSSGSKTPPLIPPPIENTLTIKTSPDSEPIKQKQNSISKLSPGHQALKKNSPILPKVPASHYAKLLPPPLLKSSLSPPQGTSPLLQKMKTQMSPPLFNIPSKQNVQKKLIEAKPLKSVAPKPSNSYRTANALDLSAAQKEIPYDAAALMNKNLNGFDKAQVASYLSEMARLSRQQGMIAPPINSFNVNHMMHAYYIQQLTRMHKAGSEALETYVQNLQNNNQTSPKSS